MRNIKPIKLPDGDWVVEYSFPMGRTITTKVGVGSSLADALRDLAAKLDDDVARLGES